MSAEVRGQQRFEDFYSKCCPQLQRVVLAWTGEVELAKEISHEVMLILWRYWGKYDNPHLFMFRLARQQIGRAKNQQEPKISVPLDDNLDRAEEILERSNVSRAGAASDSHIDLMRLVSSLPERQRDVIVLTVIGDLSHAETARILGISIPSVKTHRQRGLDALKRALVTSTGPSAD